MTRELVVATRNRKKGGEMTAILSELLGPSWTIRTLSDFPSFVEPEETGATYAENAKIKAEAACRALNKACIADDAGLEIDALNGEPGLRSKRFGGEDLPFAEKIRTLLERMEDAPERKRTARFRCAVAVASPGETIRVFESVCEGRITREPAGTAGFGYDPIFVVPELGRTFAELEPAQKNRISHRGMVLRRAAEWLKGSFGGFCRQ
ncbi:MAG: RdgB/HAM1 family non-canonical purine NTP pyrophosphatase [Armatimonadetes bacterium]|nr:RdgB/HAM1 family non-canonical purine NTP pyrophosphatase [Armatimonadota bacterium]